MKFVVVVKMMLLGYGDEMYDIVIFGYAWENG
jgi:hypothetical protein